MRKAPQNKTNVPAAGRSIPTILSHTSRGLIRPEKRVVKTETSGTIESAEVVDIRHFRSRKRKSHNLRVAQFVRLQREEDGQIRFDYEIDPRTTVAFIGAMLVMCIKLLPKPPIG